MRAYKGNAGVTLPELMIASVILGIVVAYIMGTFAASHQNYVVVDQTTEAQQNMRVVSGFMERDARHAGFMVPLAAALCGVDELNTSDSLYLSDSTVIEPGNRVDADFGAEVTGVSNIPTGNQNLALDDVVIDGTASYDTNGDGAMDSDFQVNGGVIIADVFDPTRGAACGRVTAVNAATDTISVTILSDALTGGTPDSELVAVPAHEYRVDNTMALLRDGQIFAQGVDDFQFAVLIDDNDNNVENPGEYRGDGTGADYGSDEYDHGLAREVRMNVVMRTRTPEDEWVQGQFQATENRVPPAGNDGFRRRVQSTTVTLRNVISRKS